MRCVVVVAVVAYDLNMDECADASASAIASRSGKGSGSENFSLGSLRFARAESPWTRARGCSDEA